MVHVAMCRGTLMPRFELIATAIACTIATGAHAQPDTSGIDFVTIDHPGNAAWQGDGTVGDRAVGRGAVDYNFRIGRFEVTTAQFVDFYNAALDRPANDRLPFVTPPGAWGAIATTPNNPGGQRWTVPAGGAMIPVGGLDWRTCAMFCNWEHHDRAGGRSSFLSGAYDVSTFGYGPNGFTDQLVRSPGARFWVPTWDEFLKASHYDPNRFGPGQGGWWVYSNGTNDPLTYGPPGVHVRTDRYGPDPNGPLAMANAGWDSVDFPGYDPYAIPLGAYTATQTPWGLFDTAGGSSEWSETALLTNDIYPTHRAIFGSALAHGFPTNDRISFLGGEAPSIGLLNFGFRIASDVPSPSSCTGLIILGMSSVLRRRRQGRKYTTRMPMISSLPAPAASCCWQSPNQERKSARSWDGGDPAARFAVECATADNNPAVGAHAQRVFEMPACDINSKGPQVFVQITWPKVLSPEQSAVHPITRIVGESSLPYNRRPIRTGREASSPIEPWRQTQIFEPRGCPSCEVLAGIYRSPARPGNR
jgi:hypothetical protein